MSFQILDHLDELEKYGTVVKNPTWVEATCPICNGKLKISKNNSKYGAYACYTNNCHAKYDNPIRKLLYKKMPFGNSTAFKPVVAKKSGLVEIVEPKLTTASAKDFLTNVPFVLPEQVRVDNKLYTYFQYEGFRIVRLDAKLASGEKRKYMYPEYRLKNGDYVQGLPTTIENLPIYTSSYLQPAMVFAEGEKTATMGQKLGVATVTFPTFAFSEHYLAKYAKELRGKGLTDVLYLEDNDEAGKKKSGLVSKYFWKYDIATKVVNLVDLFTDCVDRRGFDLYDAYKLNLITKENVCGVIEELLCL